MEEKKFKVVKDKGVVKLVFTSRDSFVNYVKERLLLFTDGGIGFSGSFSRKDATASLFLDEEDFEKVRDIL